MLREALVMEENGAYTQLQDSFDLFLDPALSIPLMLTDYFPWLVFDFCTPNWQVHQLATECGGKIAQSMLSSIRDLI